MVKGRKGLKVKDKWRAKKWLVVKAPPPFGGNPIAYIPVTSDDKALRRVVDTTLFDILREDPQHYSIKLYFQIASIDGDIAQTIFKGHEYAREYIRSMVRRGSSAIRLIKDYETRDKALVRVHVMVFTQDRINTSKKHAVRSIIDEVLTRKATELSYNQFAQEAVLGKIASDIYNPARKVIHIRQVGVSKTLLIRKPSLEVEEEPITLMDAAPAQPELSEETPIEASEEKKEEDISELAAAAD